MSTTNNGNSGVPGSQRDEMREERAEEFNRSMHRSITALQRDPPDMVTAFTELWSVERTAQVQRFEIEGLLSHVATTLEIVDGRQQRQEKREIEREKTARQSQPIIDAEATGRLRAHRDDVSAIQSSIENAAIQARGDLAALGLHLGNRLAAVEEAIGEAPQPGAEDKRKRAGTGLQRKVALLFNVRSMAMLVVAAFVGGGALSVIVVKLFESYLIPLLLKGHL